MSEPVAAASIAQVHFAVTTEGEEVAVKVLRPNIEQAFTRDIALFFWITELLERTRPELRRLRLREVVKKFEETVTFEMDFRLEAAAAQEQQVAPVAEQPVEQEPEHVEEESEETPSTKPNRRRGGMFGNQLTLDD